MTIAIQRAPAPHADNSPALYVACIGHLQTPSTRNQPGIHGTVWEAGRSTAWIRSFTPWSWCFLRELLPLSGIAATNGQHRLLRGLLFALFLCGWGLRFSGVPSGQVRSRFEADAYHRLVFVFLFLQCAGDECLAACGVALLAGSYRGGMAMGGTFVAEEWPEDRRRAGAEHAHGILRGDFSAALLNYWIGSRYGWRTSACWGIAGATAGWVRHGVTEPQRWRKKRSRSSWRIWHPFAILFSSGNAPQERSEIPCYMLASICGSGGNGVRSSR